MGPKKFHFDWNFLSLLIQPLSLPSLSALFINSGLGYEDSDESSSSPAEVSWVPAAVGRPVWRHHRVGTLICFFIPNSSYSSSTSHFSVLSPKLPK